MQRRLICVVFIFLPWALCAQTLDVGAIRIKGHFIGESVAELLSREPKVQQQVKACEQNPIKPTCDRLLAAVGRGERAEISNSSWTDFVLNGGQLVKLMTLVDEHSDPVRDLTKKFGRRPSETGFTMQNALGASWEDHLFVWDTPAVCAILHEDNNPASQNHHYVLVVESRTEYEREHADQAKPSAAKTEN